MAGIQPPSAGRRRLAGIDALKAFAIAAVILIHIPRSPVTDTVPWQLLVECCRFAVPCFFLISGFLFMRTWKANPAGPYLILKYVRRLGLAFLIWSFFYAVVPPFPMGAPHGISSAIRDHFANALHHPRYFLVNGSAYHLWFLPALLLGLVITWLCMNYAWTGLGVFIGATLFCVALSGGPYSSTLAGFHTDYDLKNGPYFSTLFVALGAWAAAHEFRIPRLWAGILAISGLLVSIGELYFLQRGDFQTLHSISYSIGTIPFALGVFFFALSCDSVAPRIAWIGSLSLGIYVAHPYLIEVVRQSPLSIFFSVHPLAFAAAILLASIGAVSLLARIPPLRKLVT
jgi:surface polysaccharide O-acyltransferase-like enzyme